MKLNLFLAACMALLVAAAFFSAPKNRIDSMDNHNKLLQDYNELQKKHLELQDKYLKVLNEYNEFMLNRVGG